MRFDSPQSQDSLSPFEETHHWSAAGRTYTEFPQTGQSISETSISDLATPLTMLEDIPWVDQSQCRCYQALLSHWTHVLLPQRFSFDTECIGIFQTRHAHAIQSELDEALSQPEHLYSLLASVAVQTLHAPTASLDCDDIVNLALDLHSRALKAVRAAMDRGIITFGLLRDMQRLLTVAYLTDMEEYASVHFAGMTSMIERVGGLSFFDRYFIENEVVVHWYAGLRTLQAPSITLFSSIPHPVGYAGFRKQHCAARHQQLGRKFADAGIDTEYRVAIQDLSAILDFAAPQTSAAYDAEFSRWLSLQHLSVGYRLLAMSPTQPLEQALRTACVYFVALTRAPFDRSCAVHSINQLRAALSHALRDESHLQLLLWIAGIGGLVALGTPDEIWFANVVAQLQVNLGIRSLESLEAHFRLILYDDRLRELLEKFWLLLPTR